MESSGSGISKKTVVSLGVGIAVLLAATAGIGYFYGSYIQEVKDHKKGINRAVKQDPEEEGQDNITEEEDNEQLSNNTINKGGDEINPQILMLIQQVGLKVAQEKSSNRLSVESVAAMDSLIYELGEKKIIANYMTYKGMRRGIIQGILNQFPSAMDPATEFTMDIIKLREAHTLSNLPKIAVSEFCNLLICVQSENEGVNMITIEELRRTLQLVNCSEELYTTSYKAAITQNPQIRQISLMKLQGLVGKMKASDDDPKRPRIDKDMIVQMMRFKITAFKKLAQIFSKVTVEANQNPNLGELISGINTPQMRMGLQQKILEDLVAFVYRAEPQDIFARLTLYEMDPEIQKLGMEFMSVVQGR